MSNSQATTKEFDHEASNNTPQEEKPVESLKTADRDNKKNDNNQNGGSQKNNSKANNKHNQSNSNKKNGQQEAKSELTNVGSNVSLTNEMKQESTDKTVRSDKTKEHDNNRSRFATSKTVRSVKTEVEHSSDTFNSVRSEEMTGDVNGVAGEQPVNSNTPPNDTELQLLIPLGAKNSQSIQIYFLTILKKRRQQ